MAEYIERSEAIEFIKHNTPNINGETTVKCVIRSLKNVPAADVAEVVRCNDCVYCCISTDPKTNISIQKCGYVGFNPVQSSQVSDDFYCSRGERKESK